MRDHSQTVATAVAALRYLANNPRPAGGSSTYNSEHLWDIANNLTGMNAGPRSPVKLPAGLAKNIKDEGYYRGICDMMDCIRAAGVQMEGDE